METVSIETAVKKTPVKDQIIKALDGRTNRWLANKIGMGESSLSMRLKRKTDFSLGELEAIANVLNITITI